MALPTVCYLSNSSFSSSCDSMEPPGKKMKGGRKVISNHIPTGDKLTDSSKKEWIVHESVASGGFGEIYTASTGKNNQQSYVIKIEPFENGPLFCEKTVYIRIGKKEDIKEFMKSKGLKCLGMPQFFGSGIHCSNGKKFRFLVMERYGTDLWSIYLEKNRKFPPSTVYKIANQVLDVLEYIHSKGYVHADIKGANLLLGRGKGYENQVYLVDFGLAARYTTQYKPDPRRAHNGTLEYTSRDGHKGIVTRRGDIEVLGFNLLQWESSNLPWEETKDLHAVQEQKNKYMENINNLLQTCFRPKTPSSTLEKYFKYLVKMDPLAEPKYQMLKQIMTEGIEKTGDVSPKLEFSTSESKKKKSVEPTPPKVRKIITPKSTNSVSKALKKVSKATINISSSSNECHDNDDESEDDFIESTPEKKQKIKRSWKDCPSVVSCAELLLKDNRTVRRSKRNK